MKNSPHWLQWLTPGLIGAVIGFVLAQLPNYYELYKKYFAEHLRVSISSWFTGRVLYRVYPVPGGEDVIPVETYIYVYLTNTSDRPLSIKSYSVSVKADGEWQRLVPLRYVADEQGTVVAFWRNQGIMRLDLSREGFDWKAKREAIAPNSTLSGWLFFETQPTGKAERFKFEFVDSTNVIHSLVQSTQVKKEGFASLESAYIPLGPAEPIPEFMRKFQQSQAPPQNER